MWKMNNDRIAVIDNKGHNFTYRQINKVSEACKKQLGDRCVIYFKSTKHSIADIVYYIALIEAKYIVIMVDNELPQLEHDRNINNFRPKYIYENGNFTKANMSVGNFTPHKDLALVIPTSGTTGESKFACISYKNIQSSMTSIVKFQKITKEDRAILNLPMFYIFGLSIIHSQLAAGGSIYTCEDCQPYSMQFWREADKYNCTSFSHTSTMYSLMKKFGTSVIIPKNFRYFAQSGSLFPVELQDYYSDLCKKFNISFYLMYGATEATSRMAYLPPEDFFRRRYSVGKAIPAGRITLDEDTNEIIYKGNNVCMGYAKTFFDLKEPFEPNNGVLHTGDIGKKEDGYLYIIGRLKRNVKIYDLNINMDVVEQKISDYKHKNCIVDFFNNYLYIMINGDYDINDIINYLYTEHIHIDVNHTRFLTGEIIYNNNTKKDYQAFREQCKRSFANE